MLAEMRVGQVPAANSAGFGEGAFSPMQATRTGEQRVSQAHARYAEAVARGNCFAGGNAAAVTFGTALTATGVTFHLYNPAGSKVNLYVMKCVINIITATTSGTIVYAANIAPTAAVPATNTAITIVNLLLGSANAPQAKLYSVTTLPAAPTQLRPVGGAVATAAANAPSTVIDDVNGEIVVGQGCVLSVQGITIAGTGIIGMSWEECPVT